MDSTVGAAFIGVVNWSFLSGFFDGEGGILVNYGASRRVVRMAFGISQKSHEVLDGIEVFLRKNWIHPIRGKMKDGTHYLRVNRADEMILMASKLKLVVRARQVRAAADYLKGEITGNEFLAILQEEFLRGNRKSKIPDWALNRFPMTRLEAKRVALDNASVAGSAANRMKAHRKAIDALASLPVTFTSVDLMRSLDVGRGSALKQGKFLELQGLVSVSRLRGPGRPKLKFTKIEGKTQL